MKFAHPEFLWASLLIAIPIIIHLFNFRKYKTVYFSRVSFLKEVTEDSRTGVKLKHLLILASRILAILFLVLAFAQPFIPSANQEKISTINLIYLDNSFSMEAKGQDGDLLNECKNKALELVKSFQAEERVYIFTSDLKSDEFRMYSPKDALDRIKKIVHSPASKNLTTILNAQLDQVSSLKEESNVRLFLFSDFQKSTSDLSEFKREPLPLYFFKATPQQIENIFVDSVWFETPVHRTNTPSDIFFRIQNRSSMAQQDLSVSLVIEGSQPAPKRISVEANSFAIGSINFTDRTPGIKTGKIQIMTSQLYFDDSYYFTYTTKENVKILLIKNSAADIVNLEQLYSLDSYYSCETTTLGQVTQENFKGKELIVFQNANDLPGGMHDLIREAVKNGSTVVLIPGTKADLTSWNKLLGLMNMPALGSNSAGGGDLSYFNSEDPLYRGVFESTPSNYKFAKVLSYYPLRVSGNQNFMTVFGFNTQNPYFIYSQQANGRIYLAASPLSLDHTDFQNHALFAATYLRIAETASLQKPLAWTIGNMENYPVHAAFDEKDPLHLIQTEHKVDFIPQFINNGSNRQISFAPLQDEIKHAGIYELKNESGFTDKIALNYDRSESEISAYTAEEVDQLFEEAGWLLAEPLQISDKGKLELNELRVSEFWRWCLILALIFVTVEILLLKFWKT